MYVIRQKDKNRRPPVQDSAAACWWLRNKHKLLVTSGCKTDWALLQVVEVLGHSYCRVGVLPCMSPFIDYFVYIIQNWHDVKSVCRVMQTILPAQDSFAFCLNPFSSSYVELTRTGRWWCNIDNCCSSTPCELTTSRVYPYSKTSAQLFW